MWNPELDQVVKTKHVTIFQHVNGYEEIFKSSPTQDEMNFEIGEKLLESDTEIVEQNELGTETEPKTEQEKQTSDTDVTVTEKGRSYLYRKAKATHGPGYYSETENVHHIS